MADIKKIAAWLSALTMDEVNALAQVLAEEYGIVSQRDVRLRKEFSGETVNVLKMKDASNHLEMEKMYARRQQMYVPKKIGKPCRPFIKRRK